MKDYKNEIEKTRVGCLGSSDGQLLAQIANFGGVPHSATRRLAVVKGLVENKNIPTTAAVIAGDQIEQAIYENLKHQDERYESNPLWVSSKYSKPNVKLISHPDIVLKDEEKKQLRVYEVKTTRFSVEDTKHTYRSQLFIHFLLAKEIAQSLGKGWSVKLALVHYDTKGLDLENGVEFDPDRVTVCDCHFRGPVFDINKAMTIVDAYLEELDFYAEGDEIDAELLPDTIKERFDGIATILKEIKEREDKVNDFKARLYEFLLEKGIKSIKNDVYSITRVDASESRTFDHKRYLEDYAKKYPRKVNKIRREYEKVTQRKGYASIKLVNKNKE